MISCPRYCIFKNPKLFTMRKMFAFMSIIICMTMACKKPEQLCESSYLCITLDDDNITTNNECETDITIYNSAGNILADCQDCKDLSVLKDSSDLYKIVIGKSTIQTIFMPSDYSEPGRGGQKCQVVIP